MNISAEVFVVDNASIDGSKEYLEAKFPRVIFKWEKENLGFSKANNSVLMQTKGDLILFLNPDTILPEDCFEKCIAFFKLRENCGALGVRMIDGAGNFLRESKRSFPSAAASFFKITGMAKIFPRSKLFSKYYAGNLPEDQINIVDVLAGAFLMVSKKAIIRTGGFDEDFFMYGEDIDLAFRIQIEGLENYYFPETTIVHFKGESTQKKSKLYIDLFYAAMHLFVKKHYKHDTIPKMLLGTAISFSRLLAVVRLQFINMFGRKKKLSVTHARRTLVVAGQPGFNQMIQLIKHAPEPFIIQGRIAIDNDDRDTCTGHLKNIENLIRQNKTSDIIFCEELLSFKKMITTMQILKGKSSFFFHANGSESVVGSDDRNERGIFISR